MTGQRLLKSAQHRLARGDVANAARDARQALIFHPGFPAAWFILTASRLGAGQHQNVDRNLKRILALNPLAGEVRGNLGELKRSAGQVAASLHEHRLALIAAPGRPSVNLNFCAALAENHRDYILEAATGRCQTISPLNSDLFLFQALCAKNRNSRETLFRKSLLLSPRNRATWGNLGSSLSTVGDLAAVETALRQALIIDPYDTDSLYNLGAAFDQFNRREAAKRHVLACLALQPDYARANVLASGLFRDTGGPERHASRLTAILPTCPDHSLRATVAYELARCHDSAGDVQQAWDMFGLANSERAVSPEMAKAVPEIFFQQIAYEENAIAWIQRHNMQFDQPETDNRGRQLVFLVGFSRSGTTLVGRILDAHKSCRVTDEHAILNNRYLKMLDRESGGNGIAASLPRDLRDAWQEDYLAEAQKIKAFGPNDLFVDKMPFNMSRLRAIATIFPAARVILVVRHPMDVCLSNYMQDFFGNHALSNFLEMGRTVKAYKATMALWKKSVANIPIPVFTVRYEELVQDFDTVTTDLLSFLDLEEDDAIRDFARHSREGERIRTPSYNQVSRDIYQDASYRWERYRAQLDPWLEDLAPLIREFGYRKV